MGLVQQGLRLGKIIDLDVEAFCPVIIQNVENFVVEGRCAQILLHFLLESWPKVFTLLSFHLLTNYALQTLH
jgi:hypothetical protein